MIVAVQLMHTTTNEKSEFSLSLWKEEKKKEKSKKIVNEKENDNNY